MHAQTDWFSTLGLKVSIDVPIYVILGSQSSDGIDNVADDNGVFSRPHVFIGRNVIGKERYPETSLNENYAKQKYF